MKKLILSLLFLTFLIPTAYAASFTDMPEDHTYYAAVESLKNLGIVSGNPDGSFRPENPVNRAEALKMILNSAEIESSDDFVETGFPDVPNDAWFAKFIVKAKLQGIVNGNPDGSFAPERLVNKAEFLKMLLESFEEDMSKHQNLEEGVSADTFADQWFLSYISYAKTIGIIYPSMDNKLEPEKFLTRGESAEIIYKLLIIKKGGDVQKLLSIAESNLVSVLVELNNDNIQSAINHANSAIFYTEKALEKMPDEGIVRAANKIALGFQKLALAYEAGLEKRNDDLRTYIEESKDLAGQAYNDDPSTQALGKKLKEQGDRLLQQIEQI